MAASVLLSRAGHRVTLFERFKEPQPLGSGLMLQPTGLAVLHQLGIGRSAIERGQRIDRLYGRAGGRVVLDVRYASLRSGKLFGVGIHRAALFSLLYEALVAEKVGVATSREISGVEQSSRGVWLLFSNAGREGPFDLIVDALGTRSALAPDSGRDLSFGALWVNVSTTDAFACTALTQRYWRASVMAGILPIGRGGPAGEPLAAFFWSLRSKDYAAWREGGLDRWKQEVSAFWPETSPLLEQLRGAESLTFARYAQKTLKRPVEERLIHIGDSWHSASPQLGQGANMALLDAYALALALQDSADLSEALTRAARLRGMHVRLYQLLTAVLTPVYQSDSRLIPFLRDWLMGPASKLWPLTSLQAALVSGLVGSPLSRLGLDFAPLQRGR